MKYSQLVIGFLAAHPGVYFPMRYIVRQVTTARGIEQRKVAQQVRRIVARLQQTGHVEIKQGNKLGGQAEYRWVITDGFGLRMGR